MVSKQQDSILWVTTVQHYHSGEGRWDKQLVSESWRNQGHHVIHLIFSMSDDVKRENVGDSTVVFNYAISSLCWYISLMCALLPLCASL